MSKARTRRGLALVPDRASRVLLYIRVSALMNRGGDDFHSPEIQTSTIRRKTLGMQEVGVIDCDIDQTGTTFAREGIDKVKELAEARAFDVLAVYNVARLGRNTYESLKFLNELADHGITIISAREHIDTSTPSGRKHLTDLLSGAQMRSEEIGEDWSAAIEHRFQQGHHPGRNLGYLHVDKRKVKDPLWGPLIEEAFSKYAKEIPTRQICAYIYASTGRHIEPKNLKRMLENSVYIGQATLHGHTKAGNHEPLVKPDVWQTVQTRLARERGEPPRVKEMAWFLAGLVRCGSSAGCPRCGDSEMCPVSSHGPDHYGVERLICGHQAKASAKCAGVATPVKAQLEAGVLDRVTEHISQLKINLSARVQAMMRAAEARTDAATLRAQQDEARAAITKLVTSWALGKVPDHAYEASLAELRAAESAAATGLKEAEAISKVRDPGEIIAAAEAMLELWPDLIEPERARLIRKIVKRVVIAKPQRRGQPLGGRIDVQFH